MGIHKELDITISRDNPFVRLISGAKLVGKLERSENYRSTDYIWHWNLDEDISIYSIDNCYRLRILELQRAKAVSWVRLEDFIVMKKALAFSTAYDAVLKIHLEFLMKYKLEVIPDVNVVQQQHKVNVSVPDTLINLSLGAEHTKTDVAVQAKEVVLPELDLTVTPATLTRNPIVTNVIATPAKVDLQLLKKADHINIGVPPYYVDVNVPSPISMIENSRTVNVLQYMSKERSAIRDEKPLEISKISDYQRTSNKKSNSTLIKIDSVVEAKPETK